MSQFIEQEVSERIMQIRINRPEKKNALTQEMYLGLAEALAAADDNPEVRVAVLTGSHGVFTSGNDIADFVSGGMKREELPVETLLRQLAAQRKPVIAAVPGMAIGIGVTMLLHCDLGYASAGARLQMPFTKIGICPEAASSLILPQIMGRQRASELLLLGEPFSAETALELGLLNGVYAESELLEQVLAVAGRLAAQPPNALRQSKALIRNGNAAQIEATIREEIKVLLPLIAGEEAQEAMMAFMQKRKPDFSRFN